MDQNQYAVEIDVDDLSSTLDEISREAIRQARQTPQLVVTITIDQTISPALVNAEYQHNGDTKASTGDTSQRVSSGAEISSLGEQRESTSRFDILINAWLAAVD